MISKCIDVYKNINIQIKNNSVEVSPCCLFPTQATDKLNFDNDPLLNLVRTQWNQDTIPTPCQNCARHEHSNHWYNDNGYANTNVELLRVDYWTGDVCNLKCIICGPDNSSAWKEELKIPIIERKQTVNYSWKDLDLTKLKFVHFNGGEPLLSKEHVKFLHAIPIKSLVHINYNTNGTILPSEELLRIWEQFKLVQIDFSIDDIGDRFEYQRYPARWEQVTNNLNWYIDNCSVNCMFAVNTTVSVLNQDNLANLTQWLRKNFNANRVTDPIEYRTQDAIGIFAVDNTNKKQIIDFLNSCDQRRGTDWKHTFPELVEKLS
jgi:sulfatase maturation enzyme AslB (radical SAM superfamily)